MYGTQLVNLNRQRPYHCEYTGSRPITEVKHSWAWIVLAWVTCWEYQVLLAHFTNTPFTQRATHSRKYLTDAVYFAQCTDVILVCMLFYTHYMASQ